MSDATAPGAAGVALDLASLMAGARSAGVPADSVAVVLRRVSDSSVAFDHSYADDLLGQVSGIRAVRADIPLRVSPEEFLLHVDLRSGGTVYYTLDTRVTVIAGVGATTPPLPLEYVGPGRDADSLAFALVPSLLLAGDSMLAAALVYEGGLLRPGVPVGYASSDSALVRVRPSAPGTAWLVAAPDAVGVVTITAVTPNGLSRMAQLAVLAPPAALGTVAGGSKTALAELPVPAR